MRARLIDLALRPLARLPDLIGATLLVWAAAHVLGVLG